MTRTSTPLTLTQEKLIRALKDYIKELDDPNPDVIIDASLTWEIESYGGGFGKLPMPRFSPSACATKRGLIETATEGNEPRQERINQIRQKHGFQEARNREAKLFDSQFKSLMFKVKKAVSLIAQVNMAFCKNEEQLSTPIRQLQQIVLEEQAGKLKK